MEPELARRLDRDDRLDRERRSSAARWAGRHQSGPSDHACAAHHGPSIARCLRVCPYRQSYAQLQPSGERRSSIGQRGDRVEERRPGRVVAGEGLGRHSVRVRARPSARSRRRRPPRDRPASDRAARRRPSHGCPPRPSRRGGRRGRASVQPGVSASPTQRSVRDGPDQPVEVRGDRRVLRHEVGVVGGSRVLDERIAIRLADAQGVGPRLDDPEMVQVVAVERHVDPAPRLVGPDLRVGSGPDLGEHRDAGPDRVARGCRREAWSSRAPDAPRSSDRSRRPRSRSRRARSRSSRRGRCTRRRARATRRCGRHARRATSPDRRRRMAPHPAGARRHRRGRPTSTRSRSYIAASSAHRSRLPDRKCTERSVGQRGAAKIRRDRPGHRSEDPRVGGGWPTLASSWSPSSTVRR